MNTLKLADQVNYDAHDRAQGCGHVANDSVVNARIRFEEQPGGPGYAKTHG